MISPPKIASKGSILIVCLLFLSLLLVLGMSFLASRAGDYRGARQSLQALEARGIALAGLEQTRLKLLKDFDFPPIAAVDQPAYEIVETVYDPDGKEAGTYMVTLVTDHVGPPYYMLEIQSVGFVGDPLEPSARRKLVAMLDLRDPDTNPNYFKLTGVQDFGEM